MRRGNVLRGNVRATCIVTARFSIDLCADSSITRYFDSSADHRRWFVFNIRGRRTVGAGRSQWVTPSRVRGCYPGKFGKFYMLNRAFCGIFDIICTVIGPENGPILLCWILTLRRFLIKFLTKFLRNSYITLEKRRNTVTAETAGRTDWLTAWLAGLQVVMVAVADVSHSHTCVHCDCACVCDCWILVAYKVNNVHISWSTDGARRPFDHSFVHIAVQLSLNLSAYLCGYAAFTPDRPTCSPDTSCIHLYPLSRRLHVSCIGDKIVVTATRIRARVSMSRTLLRTCIRRRIQSCSRRNGYKLLVRDIRLYLV